VLQADRVRQSLQEPLPAPKDHRDNEEPELVDEPFSD
jgi:hypothetical protein